MAMMLRPHQSPLRCRVPFRLVIPLGILLTFLTITHLVTFTDAVSFPCSSYDNYCTSCTATDGCGFCSTTQNCLNITVISSCPKPARITTHDQCSHQPCQEPNPIDNSLGLGTCNATVWGNDGVGFFADNSTCSQNCMSGYSLSGDTFLTCSNHTWTGTQQCTASASDSVLPSGKMTDVDWGLLVYSCLLSIIVFTFCALLATGVILPRLGHRHLRISSQLWGAYSGNVERGGHSQRCQRCTTPFLGICALFCIVFALVLNEYSTASLPKDVLDISITFRVFSLTVDIGSTVPSSSTDSYSHTYNYSPCDTKEEDTLAVAAGSSDVVLCYLWRGTFTATFIFGILSAIASSIAITLLYGVICTPCALSEKYWRYSIRYALISILCAFTSVLLYGSVTHIVLKHLYSNLLSIQLTDSWFLLLLGLCLSGFFLAATHAYYEPERNREEMMEGEEPLVSEQQQVIGSSSIRTSEAIMITNSGRGSSSDATGSSHFTAPVRPSPAVVTSSFDRRVSTLGGTLSYGALYDN